MESESLISISFLTKFGIEIYSSKVIDQFELYCDTLRDSGIQLSFKYVDDDSEIIDIADLIEAMESSSFENAQSFIDVFGREFNSSRNYRIFDMIEEEYKKHTGTSINNSPVFQKYNELFRKIKVIEKQSSDLWKKLTPQQKINVRNYSTTIEECYELLKSPHHNESLINEHLIAVVNIFKTQKSKDTTISRVKSSPVITPESQTPSPASNASNTEKLFFKKHPSGYLVSNHNLLYDPKRKIVVGVSSTDNSVSELTETEMIICEKYNLKY